MLEAAQITAMRSTAARALPDTATIRRKTVVSDGGGGTTVTWADLATGVPCHIAPMGGGETGTAGDRIQDETTHVATFAAGADVTEADRLVIDSVTYEVTAVRARGEWELARRVECKEAP